MTRRRLLLALGVVLAVLVAVSAWLALREPGGPGITAANCARIKKGMRLKEVEAILGGPPGIYYEGLPFSPYPLPADGEEGTALWVNERGGVMVWLRSDGTVERTSYSRTSRPSPLLQWVIDCFHRLFP